MVSPQIENGYTKIANELLDAIVRCKLPGDEGQVFWTIIRKTYGFNKKMDRIALSQFNLATGLLKPNVCRALSNLIKKNMIIKSDKENLSSYRIQKDYTKWKPLSKLIMLSDSIKSVIKSDKRPLSDSINYKRNNIQKTILQKKERVSPEPKITFCFTTESWLNIPTRDIQRWKETYPACDIDYELKKMADWLIANPTKKKKNYKSFISRWLTSTQDKGGSYKQVRRESMSSEALRKKMSRPVKEKEG